MSKLDELRKSAGQNVKDSTGGDRHAAPAPAASGPPPRWRGVVRSRDAAAIPLDMIVADPSQPRTEFDEEELARLAESLRTRGQLQPCRVKWVEEQGVYMVLVGERRMRAARLAGLATLDCVMVEEPIAADELLVIQLVENALREDLKPVEQARAYRRLMDAKSWSTRELAAGPERLGQAGQLLLVELGARLRGVGDDHVERDRGGVAGAHHPTPPGGRARGGRGRGGVAVAAGRILHILAGALTQFVELGHQAASPCSCRSAADRDIRSRTSSARAMAAFAAADRGL